jgi:tRNA pseudouridine38-40 synthase
VSHLARDAGRANSLLAGALSEADRRKIDGALHDEVLRVRREGDEIIIEAEARSFLHHQIRNLAGTLAEVGRGRRPEAWPRQVLESRDRAQAGQTAPPDGLCFMWVRYDAPPDWV